MLTLIMRRCVFSFGKSKLFIFARYLTSLSILHINNNEIATLDARVLNNLPSLTILEWRNNDPTCDCDISWLKDWMQDNPNVTIDYDTKVLDNCEAFYNSSS